MVGESFRLGYRVQEGIVLIRVALKAPRRVCKDRRFQQKNYSEGHMNIYVASSWRNLLQTGIVAVLRKAGHEVYDFRNPAPGNNGFGWSQIDPNWQNWTPDEYRKSLNHEIAQRGFKYDMDALRSCDACVLVLPSGRSASWEFGWAIGAGKRGAVIMLEKCEPELMYLGNPILTSMDDVMDWAGLPRD